MAGQDDLDDDMLESMLVGLRSVWKRLGGGKGKRRVKWWGEKEGK